MLSNYFRFYDKIYFLILPILGLLNFFIFDSRFIFIFLIFFTIFIYSLKKIYTFSGTLYSAFLFSFFFKIILLILIYKLGFNLNFQNGDIGGSDSQSYFYNSYIIGDIFRLDENFSQLFNFEIILDSSFYYYNYFLKIIIPEIQTFELGILNIFYINFAFIIFFDFLNDKISNNRIIFTTIFLLLIDLKLFFFSIFNLEESLLIFLTTLTIYSFSNLTSKVAIIKNSIFFISSFLFIFLIKFNFALLFFISIAIFFIFTNYLFEKKLNNKNIFIAIGSLIFLIIIFLEPYFLKEYFATKYANVAFTQNSIGSLIMNFNIINNPLGVILQFFASLIGIFPLYKTYTLFIEFEKFAVIFFHFLLIASFFGLKVIYKEKKYDFELLYILACSLLYLIICSIISFGGLEFIRYSLPINFLLAYLASHYLQQNIFNKIKFIILIYFSLQLSLMTIYFIVKKIMI